MTHVSVEEFQKRLPQWEQSLATQSPVEILGPDRPATDLLHSIRNLRRRLREGPSAPVRVSFFGATGVGKSKLFSSVIGQPLSPSGYRRPFTRRPVAYLHRYWQILAETLEGEVRIHDDDRWLSKLIVDTPDFDSIESQNREEAERIFAEADAFIFVTDSLKYADASTWTYLKAIHQAQKELLVVLNKVQSATVVESFLDRYRTTIARDDGDAVLPSPIVVPELPLGDEDAIPESEPSLGSIRQWLATLEVHDGPTSRERMLRLEAEGVFASAEAWRQRVRQCQTQSSELLRLLQSRLRESEQRLDDRLSVSLDPSVRDEVFQRVMGRINQMDVMRYPRRLLSMPVRAARYLLFDWWWKPSEAPTDRQTRRAAELTSQESFQSLEAEVLQLSNQLRIDILGQPGWEPFLTRERFRDLRLDHEGLKSRFREQDSRFREWVAEHARETASQITTENRAKFFLSQLLFNSVLITAQLHTGGLSIYELGLDSVVTPFMAKGIGVLIGNEKVREFEAAAKREHQRVLAEILREVVDRFANFVQEAVRGLQPLDATLDSIVAARGAIDDVVRHFMASGSTAAGQSSPLESPS